MSVHELSPSPAFTERQLKVTADYVAPGKRQGPYASPKKIPWIQLKGQWLQQAGFDVNDTVRVRIIKGCLVITPINKAPEDAGEYAEGPALLEAPHLSPKAGGKLIQLPGSLR